jgi:SAM-dependent methyltransferase
MSTTPDIHLSICQPLGSVHWLGLLDQARYFRWQFRRLGAHVTIAKNRLRHGAINLVFGAHDGFDPAHAARHTCIFVNLEQLGEGGRAVSPNYLRLLGRSAVIDYDLLNAPAYAADPADVQVAPILYAPYLEQADLLPLEQRPIDLLFIGSMNERRRAWIDRIEATGRSVAMFDAPMYGADRDRYIVQAKAVLNTHFYGSCRFEQARVSHCLSLGTPVISERTAQTRPHDAFEDSVLWLQGDELEQFFTQDFDTPAYFEAARAGLARFRAVDPVEAYADVLAFAQGFAGEFGKRLDSAPWKPRRINLGSGKDYQGGWLNLDVVERTRPDLLLDLARPLALPLAAASESAGPVLIEEGSIDLINANNVLEHVPSLVDLMGNCLRLLAVGGEFRIEVPYERAATAWQDPTHVRALNENSWIYYTEWFWYLGWYDHRFDVSSSTYLDIDLKPCGKDQAAFMRVALRKIETTPLERMQAQALQADIRLPDDAVDAIAPAGAAALQPSAPAQSPQPAAQAQQDAPAGLAGPFRPQLDPAAPWRSQILAAVNG